MYSYNMFADRELNASILDGYKKIKIHLIYDVKLDSRHCARLVADDHLTELPTKNVYIRADSLRGLHMLIFVAGQNELVT